MQATPFAASFSTTRMKWWMVRPGATLPIRLACVQGLIVTMCWDPCFDVSPVFFVEADTFVELGLECPEDTAGPEASDGVDRALHGADEPGSVMAAPVEDAPLNEPPIEIDSSPEKCKREPWI